MAPSTEAQMRSVDEQLLMDIQAYIFAFDSRIPLAVLKASFPTVEPVRLLDAIAELEARDVVKVSIVHKAKSENGNRITQRLQPIA